MFIFNKQGKFIKGVTLIELLVVIAVVGVLASVIMFVLNPAEQSKKARDAQRKSDLRQIQSALEMYRSDLGIYPNALACGSALQQGSVVYLRRIPCDPRGASYYYSLSGSTYSLIACLENDRDTDLDIDTTPPGSPPACANNMYYVLYNP